MRAVFTLHVSPLSTTSAGNDSVVAHSHEGFLLYEDATLGESSDGREEYQEVYD
jgi:hypothetical protein